PGKPRRRPSTSFGNSWIWMMLLLFLAGALIMQAWSASSSVDYGDFYALIKDPEASKNIKRITAQGDDRYLVEVEDHGKLPDAIKQKMRSGTKFTVERFRFHDRDEEELLHKLTERTGTPGPVKINQETEPMSWLMPLLVFLLPFAVLLAIF